MKKFSAPDGSAMIVPLPHAENLSDLSFGAGRDEFGLTSSAFGLIGRVWSSTNTMRDELCLLARLPDGVAGHLCLDRGGFGQRPRPV
jgi:hypothetical protein